MDRTGLASATRSGLEGSVLHWTFDAELRAALAERRPEAADPCPGRRVRLAGFSPHLHCSIIGTCLTIGELRRALTRLNIATSEASDHDLHAVAVGLAGKPGAASKLIGKRLDQVHRLAINRFRHARTEDEVRALWRESLKSGDIPGAYWATLTHPATTDDLIREAFGEIHMLSHLVGAANRADVRRIASLETERAQLQAKLERQQAQLRDAITGRDARIRELTAALAAEVMARPEVVASDRDTAALRGVVADLQKRLDAEIRRRVSAEAKLIPLQGALAQERAGRAATERQRDALRVELEAFLATLGPSTDRTAREQPLPPELGGVSLLYVGGRPHQIAHLRAIGQRMGAKFLHHDGGVEQGAELLPRLASQADLILFPVDCVSHDAAQAVKRICRQAGKQFVPLRSTGVGPFVAALHEAYCAKRRPTAAA